MLDEPAANSISDAGWKRRSALDCSIVAVGVVAVAVLTLPNLDRTESRFVEVVLWLCFVVFAVEFLFECWSFFRAGEIRNYLGAPQGAVDVLAVFPVPLALLMGADRSAAWLFASLWMLKLVRFVPGVSVLGRVLALEARQLGSVLVLFLIILVFSSVCLFILESKEQPQHFGSLPLALWWAVTTLTTTGYGDAVPHTFGGRLIAGLVMICGLGVFGLWTGILTSGFATEQRRRDFLRNWRLVSRVPLFRELESMATVEIARMLRPLDLAENTVVVRQGKPGDCMYFVVSGQVEVCIQPAPVRLGPGQFFGEVALLDGRPRSATVITTMPTTLLVLEAAEFRAFAAAQPEIARLIQKEAVVRTPQRGSQAKERSFIAPGTNGN